jgi:signal transduction histidine kinase
VDESNIRPLRQVREVTDSSLVSERNKTDQSLEDIRCATERETDDRVRVDRQEADDARAQSRVDTSADINAVIRDAKNERFQKDTKIEEQRAVEHRLREQRRSDDDAVGTERSLMDTALREERAQRHSDLNESLYRERGDTDESLSHERRHTDVEAKRRSELLQKEQSLHSVTKAALTTRNEFLAIVGHDLRNPMGNIVVYADLLLDGLSAVQIGDESKKWVEGIKRNAQTSLRLIGDILDLERFAEGKLELRFVGLDLQDLVQESVESFAHTAVGNSILLRAVPSSIPAIGLCDRDRIAQVLSNLIGNALKFTPAGGSVNVEVKQNDKEIQVSVADTGPGIAMEQQRRIFDRFAQITNKDRSGLGLGLYISKMLVEAHQGKLWVVSAPGTGSKFCFTLPKQDQGY